MSPLRVILRLLHICQDLLREALRFLRLMVGTKASLAAEVLFLRKQLAFCQERKVQTAPVRRFGRVARLALLGRLVAGIVEAGPPPILTRHGLFPKQPDLVRALGQQVLFGKIPEHNQISPRPRPTSITCPVSECATFPDETSPNWITRVHTQEFHPR